MIANAMVDIWIAEGVFPLLKYEDDLSCFRIPSRDGPFKENGFRYDYDRSTMLKRISGLDIPWHPEKGDDHFSFLTIFLGLLWDLINRTVSLPEPKRLKFLNRVDTFLALYHNKGCHLKDIEKLHGSLCYIAFVYPEGRSRLPSLSNFAASFKGCEFTTRHPPPSLFTDLRWWSSTLCQIGIVRTLIPRNPSEDHHIFVDASTSWGIGIMVGASWASFQLAPDWKEPGKDICWLETLAVEFMVYLFEALGFQNQCILIHSDNQGTIGAVDKGRSGNRHINLSIRRTYSVLSSLFITPQFAYVASEDNPADPLSRGESGPPDSRLPYKFKLPDELAPFFLPNVNFIL